MHNDQEDPMDQLLQRAMRADVPQLPAAFDARLAARVRPPRLSSRGRVLMGSYAVIATAVAGWLMRDVPPMAIAAAVIVSGLLAAGAAMYLRRLVPQG